MGGGRGKGGNAAAAAGERGGRWNEDIGKLLLSMQQQSEQQQQLLRALTGTDTARNLQPRDGKGGGGGGYKGMGSRGLSGQPGGDAATSAGPRRDRGRPAGAGMRAREGDWRCTACGAFPCFARATACYQCKRPRQEHHSSATRGTGAHSGRGLTVSAGASTYLGPIGAAGSRPMLGIRAAAVPKADLCPSQRVPGASVAARTEEARRQNSVDGEWQPACPAHPNRSPGAEATPPAAGGPAGPTNVAPVATRNSWAALFEEEQEERVAVQQGDDEEGDDGADHDMDPGQADDQACQRDHDDADEGPSEAELKATWEDHCAAYRRLEKGQPPAPPGVLAAVREQRDGAERAWRAARTPHPLHKRLRWAENELRAAEAKEAARRAELDDHVEQAARRTKDIQAMLDVDVARTARKRAALRALHQEGAQELNDIPEIGKAARAAITGIGADIAPALTAIIEQLGDEHLDIRQGLQLLSTSLCRVEGVLREAADHELARAHQRRNSAPRPTFYDIGDDATKRQETARGDDDLDAGGGNNGANGTGRTDGPGAAAAATVQRWTRSAPSEPWRKTAAASSAGAVEQARKLLRTVGTAPPTDVQPACPSQTNDLQVAERLARERALQQQQEALQRQQLVQHDPQVAAQEEQRRLQREQSRAEELHRHQEAAHRAATAAAAEEAQRKEERWASLSPEEREQARKLHEQQAAVGAHVFGSQAAGQLAGMVHQSHMQEAIQEHASRTPGWDEADVQQLMDMSPEDFARWDNERQGLR